jgi:hypothetical protein
LALRSIFVLAHTVLIQELIRVLIQGLIQAMIQAMIRVLCYARRSAWSDSLKALCMCRTFPKPSSVARCDRILTHQQIQSPLKRIACHRPTPVHLGMVNDSHRSVGMSRGLCASLPHGALSMIGVDQQINQDERAESPWKSS